MSGSSKSASFKDDISIVISGAAGQGINTVELLLTKLLKLCGYNFFATKEYMSRVRGGSNSTEIRVASHRISAFVNRIDLLIPLNREALLHLAKRVTPETLIIGEKSKLSDDSDNWQYSILDIPFSKLASEIGNPIFSNIIAVGVISGLFDLARDKVNAFLQSYFEKKGGEIVAQNVEAVTKGYDIGRKLVDDGVIAIDIESDPQVSGEIVLNGAEAVGLGALAGGCNFISSYPMSPSTAVLVYLAHQSKYFDIIAEQAEDEIAAINMALGAWYAGARAMVTTSGGGFALMTEGVSLAGMIESPVVIHLAQRPGPATGLPTKTEQGDLNLVLYAGHGEFPRIIYAPGSVGDAVFLTHRAFAMADRYQVPVFILTDQYFIDSYYNCPAIDLSSLSPETHIVKTDKTYRRYTLTDSGVSPRGVPGYGDGMVVVDSDEHDEEGHITEDMDVRIAMVKKRLRKQNLILADSLPPDRTGPELSKNLIVCWGSTYHAVREAVEKTGRDDIAILHFTQVYPLHPDTSKFFEGVRKTAIVENNATSQFGSLLKLHIGIDIGVKILKYDGMPFSVEELVDSINETFG